MQCLNIIISAPTFRCTICDKTLKCEHQGIKYVVDHIDMPNHKSRAAAQTNQTQITFLSVPDDTILQKVTFAELKMAVFAGFTKHSISSSWWFVHNHSPSISWLTNCFKVPFHFAKSHMHVKRCSCPSSLGKVSISNERSAILNLHRWF